MANVFSNTRRTAEKSVLAYEQNQPTDAATVNDIGRKLPPLNLIGPQVRRLRNRKGWTQEVLAGKLQLRGWDVSRESLAKLESQARRVPDGEIWVMAKVFGVTTDELFPRGFNIKEMGPQFRVRLSHKLRRRRGKPASEPSMRKRRSGLNQK